MTHEAPLRRWSRTVRGFSAFVWRSAVDRAEAFGFYAGATVRALAGTAAKRAWMPLAVIAIVLPALAVIGGVAQADVGDAVLTGIADFLALALANVLQMFIAFFGWLLVTMVGALIWIAQYNNFINATAVVNGWVIIRDIVNMTFVIALLLMAFGTMLGVERYATREPGKDIVRLAIAAVLVNFSRTICGLLIDLGQVIMLTFVYGFKETAGKNFLDAFRITAIMETVEATPGAAAEGGSLAFRITVSMMLALAMTVISLGAVTTMTIMLAVRIVHLWILVAISPIAFIPKGIPQFESMKSDWWKQFSSAISFGPAMAFFLWLSLIVVAGGPIATTDRGFTENKVSTSGEADAVLGGAGGGAETGSIGLTKAFEDDEIMSFIIAIALLTMGMAKAKSMAGQIGAQAGKVGGMMKKGGKLAGRVAARSARAVGGERLAEGALAAVATNRWTAPLAGNLAARGLVGLRDAQAKREKDATKYIDRLKPSEQKAFAGGLAVTDAQKARQKAALLAQMDEAKKKGVTAGNEKEFFAQRELLKKKYGAVGADGKVGDKEVSDALKELDKARPNLIIDQTENDPTKRAKMHEAARKSALNMTSAKMLDLDADQLGKDQSWMLAYANASQVNRALKDGSESQREAMLKSLGLSEADFEKPSKDKNGNIELDSDGKPVMIAKKDDEIQKMIREKQNEMKERPEMFQMLPDAKKKDRIAALTTLSQEEQARYATEEERQAFIKERAGDYLGKIDERDLRSPEVLKAITEANFGGIVGERIAGKLNVTDLKSNPDLAKQIAEGFKDKAGINELPRAIAEELRKALGDSGEQAMAAGASVDAAFGGFDAGRGQFRTPEGKKKFEDFVRSRQAEDVLTAISEDDIAANDGLNDIMQSVMAKEGFGAETVRQTAAKDPSSAFATIQALEGIAGMGAEAINAEVQRRVDAEVERSGGSMPAQELDALAKKYEEEVVKHVEQAGNVVADLKKSGDIGLFGKMTFGGAAKTAVAGAGTAAAVGTGRGLEAAGRAAGAVGRAVRGAANKVSSALDARWDARLKEAVMSDEDRAKLRAEAVEAGEKAAEEVVAKAAEEAERKAGSTGGSSTGSGTGGKWRRKLGRGLKRL